MDFLKLIVKALLRRVLVYRATINIRQLRTINNPALQKLLRAVDDALQNNLTAEEQICPNRIENVRRALSASPTEISIVDYGAGQPNAVRSKENTDQGIVKTMTVSSACKASKPYLWTLFLLKLVRQFKPLTCIELGTCLGISAAYQAVGLKLNKRGRIITLEGADTLASLAEKNFQQLSLDNVVLVRGRFQDNLIKIVTENGPIDFAFIDGHHDETATVSYFESILPHLSRKSIIIFDDIAWSEGMRRAWKTIVENKQVKISLDLRVMGICVFDDEIDNKSIFRISLI